MTNMTEDEIYAISEEIVNGQLKPSVNFVQDFNNFQVYEKGDLVIIDHDGLDQPIILKRAR